MHQVGGTEISGEEGEEEPILHLCRQVGRRINRSQFLILYYSGSSTPSYKMTMYEYTKICRKR